MEALLPLLITFGLMWVLLIRPQKRRVQMQQAVVASLRAGDEVITTSGLYGTVVSVEEDILVLEVAPGVTVRILRAAVGQRVGPDDDDLDAGDAAVPKEDDS